jgi:hypothetical protein
MTRNEEIELRLANRMAKALERIASALEALAPPKIEINIPKETK